MDKYQNITDSNGLHDSIKNANGLQITTWPIQVESSTIPSLQMMFKLQTNQSKWTLGYNRIYSDGL